MEVAVEMPALLLAFTLNLMSNESGAHVVKS
jgi:hypothetical protein